MVKINIIGNGIGNSGYAIHTRELALALDKEGADVSIETQAPQGWEQQITDPKLLKILKKNNAEGINVAITMPNMWPLISCRNQPFYGFGIFEGTKAPIQWMLEANKEKVTKVLVPSTHTKESLVNAGVKSDKIEIIPHGIDLDLFKPTDKFDPQFNELLKEKDKFTFLFVGGWSRGEKDRKNLPALLRAFTNEFKKGENVRLFVKINTVYNNQNWNLANEIKKLNLNEKDGAKFTIIASMMPRNKLNQLYSIGDVFVMPTRGEAFSLPNLESMACGLPNITTNFGGQTDYVNKKNGWLIDYKLAPACEKNVLYEETDWAEINEDKLRESMRYAFEHQNEVKVKGKQALKDAQSWTWKNSAIKLLKLINGSSK